MRVELARTAGFCYGVRRAVRMAEEAAEQLGVARSTLYRRLRKFGIIE